jgi:hypothetical protein
MANAEKSSISLTEVHNTINAVSLFLLLVGIGPGRVKT